MFNYPAEAIQHILQDEGIIQIENIYSSSELQAIKQAVDPILLSRIQEARAYVTPDEMLNLGVWPIIFSQRMMSVLFSIIPDPVLYHCHIYEIAANNNTPHIFGNELAGWHRDEDSEYHNRKTTHVSIFVYLTDVDAMDGAFEFVPSKKPKRWLKRGTPFISVIGNMGFSFVWNRSFFHRASPNRGSIRRRLLKLSIQGNEFPSVHLKNTHFQRVLASIPEGNPEMDILLGRYQGKKSPLVPDKESLRVAKLTPTDKISIPTSQLYISQLRKFFHGSIKHIKNRLRGHKPGGPAYD